MSSTWNRFSPALKTPRPLHGIRLAAALFAALVFAAVPLEAQQFIVVGNLFDVGEQEMFEGIDVAFLPLDNYDLGRETVRVPFQVIAGNRVPPPEGVGELVTIWTGEMLIGPQDLFYFEGIVPVLWATRHPDKPLSYEGRELVWIEYRFPLNLMTQQKVMPVFVEVAPMFSSLYFLNGVFPYFSLERDFICDHLHPELLCAPPPPPVEPKDTTGEGIGPSGLYPDETAPAESTLETARRKGLSVDETTHIMVLAQPSGGP